MRVRAVKQGISGVVGVPALAPVCIVVTEDERHVAIVIKVNQ